MSYKYQRRNPLNVNVIQTLNEGVVCRETKGKPQSRRCRYPAEEQENCYPDEIGTPKCDARLLSKTNYTTFSKPAQVVYLLNRAKISFGSGISLRKKYSAYKLNASTKEVSVSNNDDFDNIMTGQLYGDFEFVEVSQSKAIQDGYSPNGVNIRLKQGREPTSKKGKLWKDFSRARSYHYQAESKIHSAAIHLKKASLIFKQVMEIMTDNLSNAFSTSIEQYVSTADNEISILINSYTPDQIDILLEYLKESDNGTKDITKKVQPTLIHPAAGEYYDSYEKLLRNLHKLNGKKKLLKNTQENREKIALLLSLTYPEFEPYAGTS